MVAEAIQRGEVGRPNLTLGYPPQKSETLTAIGFWQDRRYQPQMQDDGSSGSNDNPQNTVIKRTLFREVLIERT